MTAKQWANSLNFCPIISVDGSRMTAYNVESMLEQLKKVYIERVVRNGFEDGYLYNDQLMKLNNAVELKEFENVKKNNRYNESHGIKVVILI
jgi:hypothetical protein